jgi:hypothetical protein
MAAQFKGFGSIQTNSRNDSARLDETVDIIKWIDKKWVPIRILPIAPLQVRQVWIKIYGGKEKKEFNVPRYAINFDPSNPEKPKKGVRCPYMELADKFKDLKEKPVRASDFWLFNVIDRDMQEEGPPRKSPKPTKAEAKSGHKDINSDTWTPVKVARFTMTSIMRLNELSEDNIVKDKKTKAKKQYDATDETYGFDVKVKFKKDAPGTDKYSIDKVDGGSTPLTKEEKAYLTWNLTEELLDATGRMSEKQAFEDVKRMEIVGGDEVEDDDDEDDDDGKAKKSKKKSRSLDDDDDDDDDDKKSKKKKKNKAKELFKDDDDEDEDEDEDDEDDKKSKKSKKSDKKSSKSSKDKDVKSSKKKKSSKSKIDDDDEDDDEDDKKSKKSSKKSSDKKSSKSKDDDKKSKKSTKKDAWKDDDKKSKKGGAKEKVKSKDKAKVKKKK